MTAGKGLIHAEVRYSKFKKEGGDLEIPQLWLNLPAKYKMTEPGYVGLQKDQITTFTLDQNKVKVQLIAGNWETQEGSFDSLTRIFLSTVFFLDQKGYFSKSVPTDENVFFYVVRGKIHVSGVEVPFRNLVEFENEGELIEVTASEDSTVLFGHAKSFNEPLVA